MRRKLTIIVFSLALTPLAFYLAGFRYYIVLTHSMEPTIPAGSLIVSAPLEPRVGDIVVYRVELNGEQYIIVHRIIGSEDNEFITKGDASKYLDPWTVKPQDIEGVVVLVVPLIGYAIFYLKLLIPSIVGGVAVYEVLTRLLRV